MAISMGLDATFGMLKLKKMSHGFLNIMKEYGKMDWEMEMACSNKSMEILSKVFGKEEILLINIES